MLSHSRLDGTRQAEAQGRNRRATTALEHLGESSRQRLETQEQLQVRFRTVLQNPRTLARVAAGDVCMQMLSGVGRLSCCVDGCQSRPKAVAAHSDSSQRIARRLQDALTDEMVGMAATLKSSTLALSGRLRERDALLDETDDALQRSLDNARRSRARARQIYVRCAPCSPFYSLVPIALLLWARQEVAIDNNLGLPSHVV